MDPIRRWLSLNLPLPLCLTAVLLAPAPARGAVDLSKPAPPPRPPAVEGAIPLPGDWMADAIVISSLPFDTTGSTVGYTEQYGEMCPFGCLGPDVVYQLSPTAEVFVEISVCHEGTDYDTNLYVYLNGQTMVACNEDGCSTPDYPEPWLSRIGAVRLRPGNTYSIVVSGYCGYSGTYHLTVEALDDPFFVQPDGSSPFPDISSAIGAAEDGEVIELDDGVFTGYGNRELSYGGKAITLRSRSGNPEACIIDAQGLGRGFVFDHGEGAGSVLEGVTIRNGFNDWHNGGGGLFCLSASPTIRHCVFSQNHAVNGGACGVDWDHACPVFEDCRFLDNQASGDGGAVYFLEVPLYGPAPRFVGCTFAGNVAGARGGAIAAGAWPQLVGCTIVKNAAAGPSGVGGAIYAAGGGVTLQNTIIAFNRAATFGGILAAQGTAACCDSWHNDGGNWGGIPDPTGSDGNISLDPLFCDYENRDFTLMEDSPCRPFSPPNPECDLIGAWPVACGPSAVETQPLRAGAWLSVSPNPFSVRCRISGGAASGQAQLVTVHDPAGRIVRRFSLAHGSVDWDGKDAAGRPLASGVYLVRLTGPGETTNARVILARASP